MFEVISRKTFQRAVDNIRTRSVALGVEFSFDAADWVYALYSFDRRCALCGEPLIGRNAEIDHWVPLGRGGDSRRENLLPACRQCNRSKCAFDGFVWMCNCFGEKASDRITQITSYFKTLPNKNEGMKIICDGKKFIDAATLAKYSDGWTIYALNSLVADKTLDGLHLGYHVWLVDAVALLGFLIDEERQHRQARQFGRLSIYIQTERAVELKIK